MTETTSPDRSATTRIRAAWQALAHALHEATDPQHLRELVARAGEWTREELDLAADLLARDLRDLRDHLAHETAELGEALTLDTELLEQGAAEALRRLADPTRIAQFELTLAATAADFYQTGEMATPGAFQCTACGQSLHLTRTTHLPPCPRCHGTHFRRYPSAVL